MLRLQNMVNHIELPREKKFLSQIHTKFEKLFFHAEKTWHIFTSFIQDKDHIGVGNSNILNQCLISIYSKQMKLYWSVYTHCYYGLGNEGQLPLRAMYEIQINLEYLIRSENKDETARKFFLWDYANREKVLKQLKDKNLDKSSLFEEMKTWIEEEKIKKSKDWNKFLRYGPSMLNLYELSNITGYSETYKIFYPTLSGASHGYDLTNHSQRIDSENIQLNNVPSDVLIDAVLITAIVFARDCMAILNNMLNLENQSVIEELDILLKETRSIKFQED